MVRQLLSMSGLSTVQNRRLQDIAILMYRVKNNMRPISPTYISTLFEQPAITDKLGNHDFKIPRFNTVQSALESTRSGTWAKKYGALFLVTGNKLPRPLSNITSEKWILYSLMLLEDNNCSHCSLCSS